ncbi:MAG: hypothetical protein JNM27_21750 [Leptospirales bacterium]|nr:hypothetical protein [Leptospirales bacterium]
MEWPSVDREDFEEATLKQRLILSISCLILAFGNLAAIPDPNQKPPEDLKCGRLKSGLFFHFPVPGLLIIIDRKPSSQKQHRLYDRFYKMESIEWLGECTYKLQTVEKHDPMLESEPTTPTYISIIRILDAYYEYQEKENGEWGATRRMYFLRDLEKAKKIQAESPINKSDPAKPDA